MLELKKSLGQNLLIDKNIINKILNLVELKNKTICEIGPGTGNLTESILKNKPKKILLIEKDKRLCDILISRLNLNNNCKILNEDILKFNLDSNFKEEIIFGNLPYNISTQILAKFIKVSKWPPYFKTLIFMFQKEVAERILAKPNTKNYSRISVLTNYRFEILDNFLVSKKCFFPSPKIDSKILVFRPKIKINNNVNNIENLEKITQIFFSNKRKMINKAFAKIFRNYKDMAKILNIDLSKRPSELSYNDFYKITEQYEKNRIL